MKAFCLRALPSARAQVKLSSAASVRSYFRSIGRFAGSRTGKIGSLPGKPSPSDIQTENGSKSDMGHERQLSARRLLPISPDEPTTETLPGPAPLGHIRTCASLG